MTQQREFSGNITANDILGGLALIVVAIAYFIGLAIVVTFAILCAIAAVALVVKGIFWFFGIEDRVIWQAKKSDSIESGESGYW